MGYWTINGKQYNEAEYEEYKRQKLKEYEQAQEETRRLIKVLGEAYTACEAFMEQHPSSPYGVKDDAGEREHQIYEKLRRNLGAADRAPRCEKVREDGTVCGSPQMKGYRYCYSHERMLQTQSEKLQLPALEDANGIQMAIMRVQKALIDDEITEKKAGLLLYSLQMASSNLKHTTFTSKDKKDVVTEMKESPSSPSSASSQTKTSRVIAEIGKCLPLMNADGKSTESESLQRINADGRGSGRDRVIGKLKTKNTVTTKDTKEHEGEMNIGAAVPNGHLLG